MIPKLMGRGWPMAKEMEKQKPMGLKMVIQTHLEKEKPKGKDWD